MNDFNRIVRDGVVAAGGSCRDTWSEPYLEQLAAKAHALGPIQLAGLLKECQAGTVADLIERLDAIVNLRDWKVPYGER